MHEIDDAEEVGTLRREPGPFRGLSALALVGGFALFILIAELAG